MPRQMPRALAFLVLTLLHTGNGWAQVEPSLESCSCEQHKPSKFYAGAGVVAVATLHGKEPSFLGGGKGFRLLAGTRLSENVALELNWQRTYHGPALPLPGALRRQLNAYVLDVKLYATDRSPIQTYLVGGIGGYVVSDAARVLASGPGLSLGVGIDIWLTPGFRLGFQAQYRTAALLGHRGRRDDAYLNTVMCLIDLAIRP